MVTETRVLCAASFLITWNGARDDVRDAGIRLRVPPRNWVRGGHDDLGDAQAGPVGLQCLSDLQLHCRQPVHVEGLGDLGYRPIIATLAFWGFGGFGRFGMQAHHYYRCLLPTATQRRVGLESGNPRCTMCSWTNVMGMQQGGGGRGQPTGVPLSGSPPARI
jgi:hypothetical protein